MPTVVKIAPSLAADTVIREHYLHRRPPISHAYGLLDDAAQLVGVCTYGVPASRHLQISACPTNPGLVLELNRLWCHDDQPRNTESWFVSRTLKMLPPRIVVSYADLAQGHAGYIYRALSWRYAGWTDMDRKTPRFDYIPADPTMHTRNATREGITAETVRVRRVPKVRYWTVTGSASDKRALVRVAGWPQMDWSDTPPPSPTG